MLISRDDDDDDDGDDDDRRNTLNSGAARLSALAASKQGDTVYAARLLHELVTAASHARTRARPRNSVGVPFLHIIFSDLAFPSQPNGRRRKTWTRLGHGKSRRVRSERRRERPDAIEIGRIEEI